ncbi:MAG TPA: TolC family protein [Bryobacteraceae bacterium]
MSPARKGGVQRLNAGLESRWGSEAKASRGLKPALQACSVVFLWTFGFGALFAQQAVIAPQEQVRVPPVRPFVLSPRIGVSSQAPLTLEQALAMALSNNKDIDSSRVDQAQAAYSVLAARGYFDPRAGANTYLQQATTPVASALAGSPNGSLINRTTLGDPQFSGSLPWFGSSYQLDFSSIRTTTNNEFATLSPQYQASLNMAFTQPLWRGFHDDDNRHRLEVAKKNQALTDEQFRQRVMQVINQTEDAYWELVYAYRNLEVQLEAVRLGGDQDASNRRQEQQGLLAPIDVVAAQRQLASFEVNAYSAQQALTNAENALKLLILGGSADALWSTALVPTTPVEISPPLVPLADAIDDALRNRPEMAQARISAEINQRDTHYYRELTKPQIDLIATRSNAGLAGVLAQLGANPFASLGEVYTRVNQLSASEGLAPIPVATASGVPPGFTGGYGQSVSALFGGNFPTTEVQLRISMPIRNRTAEANLASSLVQGRRISDQRELTEETIEAAVRNAMQAMGSAQARLQSAVVERQSAEQQYDSEQRQFRAGTSTLFLVQQRQTDMITARSTERRAEADLSEAIASFELATGTVLQTHHVQLR